MDRRKIKDDSVYIVNFDGATIHTKPQASESCNTDQAENKATRSGVQLRSEEYDEFDFCKFCF